MLAKDDVTTLVQFVTDKPVRVSDLQPEPGHLLLMVGRECVEVFIGRGLDASETRVNVQQFQMEDNNA